MTRLRSMCAVGGLTALLACPAWAADPAPLPAVERARDADMERDTSREGTELDRRDREADIERDAERMQRDANRLQTERRDDLNRDARQGTKRSTINRSERTVTERREMMRGDAADRRDRGQLSLTRFTRLTNARLEDERGSHLGTIQELAVDVETGRAVFAVLSVDGRTVAVPFSLMELRRQGQTGDTIAMINVDRRQIMDAPPYQGWHVLSDRQWAHDLFSFYGERPYWQDGRGRPQLRGEPVAPNRMDDRNLDRRQNQEPGRTDAMDRDARDFGAARNLDARDRELDADRYDADRNRDLADQNREPGDRDRNLADRDRRDDREGMTGRPGDVDDRSIRDHRELDDRGTADNRDRTERYSRTERFTEERFDTGRDLRSARREHILRADSELLCSNVISTDNVIIGMVHDLLIDNANGNLAFVVVRFDCPEQIDSNHGARHYAAVPWDAFQVRRVGSAGHACFTLRAESDDLRGHLFSMSEWPDLADTRWALTTYRDFGVEPYWTMVRTEHQTTERLEQQSDDRRMDDRRRSDVEMRRDRERQDAPADQRRLQGAPQNRESEMTEPRSDERMREPGIDEDMSEPRISDELRERERAQPPATTQPTGNTDEAPLEP